MASPTSRWAVARRVTESIISSTSAPRSRKNSAIVVATKAALMRTSAGWSEVATTTTLRARPSGPRSCSMNSRTSRPRSPTRAMTLTSALLPRAIMPIRVLLPTPDPAKMPIRWPVPQGISASIARTPRASGLRMLGRRSTSGGRASMERRPSSAGRPRPSSGRPRPSSTRPSSASPTPTCTAVPVATTVWPGPTPAASPSGISRVRPSRKPTTSACSGGRPVRWPGRRISQRSPMPASGPLLSTTRPMSWLTRPLSR